MALERFVALEINSQLLFGMILLPFSEQECITQHPDEVPCKQSVFFPVKSHSQLLMSNVPESLAELGCKEFAQTMTNWEVFSEYKL